MTMYSWLNYILAQGTSQVSFTYINTISADCNAGLTSGLNILI